MDARVLAFTFALSVVTGVLFGLAPALHATAPDLAAAMKEGGRGSAGEGGRRRLRSALVVVEIATAFVLLVGGGLLIRSFVIMLDRPLGFDATNVLTMSVPISTDRFEDSAQLVAHVRALATRVAAVPGVSGVGAADALPLEGWGHGMPFRIAGAQEVDRAHRFDAGFKMVLPSYFRVLGIRVIKGRALSDRDGKTAPPVAVVNQTFARRYLLGMDPIGQRLLVQSLAPGRPQVGPEIPWQIVGVIADERTSALDGTQRPGIYVPLDQSPTPFINLVVSARVDAGTLARAIEQAVHDIDSTQALSDVRTLDQIKSASSAINRVRMTLLALFAALALGLAGIGIYGVLSYTVAQRAHELGVRAALGASGRDLLALVLAAGMKLAGAGLVIGGAAALGLARLLDSLVFGIGPRDPLTFTAAALVLASVAALGCYIPARRAARLDPVAVMRD